MCLMAYNSQLTGTRILVGKTADGKRYIWYQMTVEQPERQNFAPAASKFKLPKAWQPKNTGPTYSNFMLWPVPGDFHSITALDTKSAPNALKDVEDAFAYNSRGAGTRSMAFDVPFLGKGLTKVIENDDYTTIVAQYASDIVGAMKRHNIKLNGPAGESYVDLLKQFERLYPGLPVPLILIKDKPKVNGTVCLTYDSLPEFDHLYFVPALDGHGSLDLKGRADRDHMIAVATDHEHGNPVDYTDAGISAELRKYLPKKVLGVKFEGPTPNGDFLFAVDDVASGRFHGQLVLPFGCEDGEGSPEVDNFYLDTEGAQYRG